MVIYIRGKIFRVDGIPLRTKMICNLVCSMHITGLLGVICLRFK